MSHRFLLFSIAVCGGCGALLRYGLSAWANTLFQTTFPLGTFLVNMIGCCALGALSQATELSTSISPATKTAIGVGLLGALTTFSTFSAETLERIHQGQWTVAVANVLANVLIGLLAVWIGSAMVRGYWSSL
jgi:CrcB protein